ncbi:MAG: dihydrolipoamide acetyltransferase family protein [Pseudomonadota bacterium]
MSDIYPIAVPKWGIEMVEGTINTWNKAEGDPVSKGDEVFEMESDKIVNVWDSPVDGVLRRIVAQEGDAHPVGALLGVIAGAEVADAAIDAFIADFGGGELQGQAAEESPGAATQSTAHSAASAGDANKRSSPSVRRIAQELGVDLNTVKGTGRRGRITEDDVRAAASGGADEVVQDDVEISALSATRKTIGKRLTQAKQHIPHFYLTVDYPLDGLLAHREQLNHEQSTKVSVNDLIVWCVAKALMKVPDVNVNLVGDEVHRFKHANVSVAIATDEGLYPATVRGAEQLTPVEISAQITRLADKASRGALAKEDISGGSFTVSNLGMFGVTQFTAIINPPMAAILALGKGEPRVVVRNGEPAVATMVSASLSCDHRVIDGALGARFLQALGEEIETLS